MSGPQADYTAFRFLYKAPAIDGVGGIINAFKQRGRKQEKVGGELGVYPKENFLRLHLKALSFLAFVDCLCKLFH